MISDTVAIVVWLDIVMLVAHGVLAILWSRIWGGGEHGEGTVMVNAALMYKNTGRLGNPAQTIDL